MPRSHPNYLVEGEPGHKVHEHSGDHLQPPYGDNVPVQFHHQAFVHELLPEARPHCLLNPDLRPGLSAHVPLPVHCDALP